MGRGKHRDRDRKTNKEIDRDRGRETDRHNETEAKRQKTEEPCIVVHICDPSNMGGRDRRITTSP
jgi:hypothetical protein